MGREWLHTLSIPNTKMDAILIATDKLVSEYAKKNEQ